MHTIDTLSQGVDELVNGWVGHLLETDAKRDAFLKKEICVENNYSFSID